MADFLTLNGIPVPVAVGTDPRLTPEPVGRAGTRAFSGRARRGYSTTKREWRFRTPPLEPVTARALCGLVEGEGEAFLSEDDSTYSSAGLAASATGSVTFADNTLNGGLRRMDTNGYTGRAEWPVGVSPEWTLFGWIYRPLGAAHAYRHTVLRSDGALWRDSVRDDAFDLRTHGYGAGTVWQRSAIYGGSAWAAGQVRAVGSLVAATPGSTTFAYECTVAGTTGASAPAWPTSPGGTVVDNGVTWRNVGDARGISTSFAWVPYLVPLEWVEPMRVFMVSRLWSPLPRLYAGGLFAPAEVTVEGKLVESAPVQFRHATAGWVVGEAVTFLLREV